MADFFNKQNNVSNLDTYNKHLVVIPIELTEINVMTINVYCTYIDETKRINGTCKAEFLISIPTLHWSSIAPIGNLNKQTWIEKLSNHVDIALENDVPFIAEELSKIELYLRRKYASV